MPALATSSCVDDDASEMSGVHPVQAGWSCEKLMDTFQMCWTVHRGKDVIDIELIARIGEGQCVGFGSSGHDNFTRMVGSDIVIAALLTASPLSYSLENYCRTTP